MPPPRRPLAPISPNRVQKKLYKQLTSIQRAEIAGASKCSVPNFMIADALHQEPSTVSRTINLTPLRYNHNSLPQSGRPKSWTSCDQRRLVNYIRKHPWHTWQQVKEGTGLYFSTSTLKRILESSGITNWRSKQYPELSGEVAKLRYNWAKERLHMTKEDWHRVI